MTPLERFTTKYAVNNATGCWEWQGACAAWNGYGLFRDGRVHKAHRFAYEHFVGPIPDGLELDHLCRVRRCVNPAHLEPVTHAENMARSSTALKTHCKNGHPFDAANTRLRPRGGRDCRECQRAADRRWRRKHQEAVASPRSESATASRQGGV